MNEFNIYSVLMVDLCPAVKWFSIQMVVWKHDWKSLFIVQNVQYCNEWSAKSRDFTIWIPAPYTVHYSDESSIQVFSIQIVTLFLLQ